MVRIRIDQDQAVGAQIGYLFLIFPLASGAQMAHSWSATAWTGGVVQAVSHEFAKAAMFLSAGLVTEALGHDRIAELRGGARALPIAVFAFGLGGMSLMGLPPSGGFIAKAMLLSAAVAAGQWWWAVVVPARWPARRRLCFSGAGASLERAAGADRLAGADKFEPAGDPVCAGSGCGAAGVCPAAAVGIAADRPSRPSARHLEVSIASFSRGTVHLSRSHRP
jgi:hypothetical protein